MEKLRVFFDADVLFAGAASPTEHSASQVALQLSEITLVEGLTSDGAAEEARRNLRAKVPEATEKLGRVLSRSVREVPDPAPEALRPHLGRADAKDLAHLVAALREGCTHLLTYNTADYEPGHPEIEVLTPGAFVQNARDRLSRL